MEKSSRVWRNSYTHSLHRRLAQLSLLQVKFHAGEARHADQSSLKRGLPAIIEAVTLADGRILPKLSAGDWLKDNKMRLGFHNLTTARLLCPRDKLDEFDQDPEG